MTVAMTMTVMMMAAEMDRWRCATIPAASSSSSSSRDSIFVNHLHFYCIRTSFMDHHSLICFVRDVRSD